MAYEHGNWPDWLGKIWPTWLENLGYPSPGVGDLNDLKVRLGVGDGGRWLGFVNPGWYYHDFQEQYKYLKVGTIVVSGASASGTSTAAPSFRPSWGPVLVKGNTENSSGLNDQPYREHHNSLYPARILSWSVVSSAVTSYLQATLPTSSLLIGLRDLTNLPLGSVAGTGLITNDRLYYYDYTNNKVYIKPANPAATPNIWADIIYQYPLLRFRELVVSEKDASGNAYVRPSYNQIEDVKIIRGSYTTTIVSGYHASGTITHALTGVYKGDWLVLDYWISKSFVLRDHRTLDYYCGGAAGASALDSFTIYYETSVPDIYPNFNINVPSSGISTTFNMNPLFRDGYRTGYLFHGNPASGINSYWTPTNLRMWFDKSTICRDFKEPIRAKILVTDENDIPIPYYTVTVAVNGGSAVILLPEGRTNGRGEMHYLVEPTVSASALTISASCGTLSATLSASVVASGTLIDVNKWENAFVHILVTNEKTGRGAFRLYSCLTAADGLPKNGSGTIVSKFASEFHGPQNQTYTKEINFSTSISIPNISGLAELGYVPQPNDVLFGYSGIANSNLNRGEV